MVKDLDFLSLPPCPGILTSLHYAILLHQNQVDKVSTKLFEAHGPIARLDLQAHKYIAKLLKVYGRVEPKNYVFMVGAEANRLLMTTSPDYVQRAPVAPAHFRTVDGKFETWPSLASIDGELHKCHRKLIQQAFRPKSLAGYIPMIDEVLINVTSQWKDHINIFREMSYLALNILLRTMLGIKPSSPIASEFASYYWPLIFKNRTTAELLHIKHQMWSLLKELIAARRSELGNDALSIIINTRDDETQFELSEDAIQNYMYMLIDFGQDDIARFLTYTIVTLVSRVDLLQRLLDETRNYSINTALALEERLPFTTNLLREVERLYPTVTSIFRYADTDLCFDGYYISKSTWLVSSIYLTHRLPTLFTNPLQFDPDRFAHPNQEHRTPFALMGFGGGFHGCVAANFVRILACVVLHNLFSKWHFQMLGKQVFPENVYKGDIQQFHDQIMMRVRPIDSC